jgi:hypothetical protein
MFVAAGFHAGEPAELMRPDPDNPLGYYENLAVFRLNEDILRRLGANWFDPPSVPAQLRAAPWAAPKIADAVERMLRTGGGRPIALKDPRISGMIALWGPVVVPLLHPVLVVRDPLEIARSLLARDRTPIPFSLAAWEIQTEIVLAALRGRVVTVIPYRYLFASPDVPAALVAAAAAHLTDRAHIPAPSVATGTSSATGSVDHKPLDIPACGGRRNSVAVLKPRRRSGATPSRSPLPLRAPAPRSRSHAS